MADTITDLTPADYGTHHDRLIGEGYRRGARDERCRFYHPDGRRARLAVAMERRADGLNLFMVLRTVELPPPYLDAIKRFAESEAFRASRFLDQVGDEDENRMTCDLLRQKIAVAGDVIRLIDAQAGELVLAPKEDNDDAL